VSEASIQNYIMKKLSEIPFSEWEKATITNRAGSQDIKGHIRGYYIAIEVKTTNGKLSRIQEYRIVQTNKKGALSFWSTSWNEVSDKLNEFARTKGFALYDGLL